MQKTLRGEGNSTAWPVHSFLGSITNNLKGKKGILQGMKKTIQKTIQNTKRLTESGRMNKNNDHQT